MPPEQPDQPGLAEACRRWQTGRDGGSSLLRGGARVLSQTAHYFTADFIQRYEERASADQSALDDAQTLLNALRDAPSLVASGWAELLGLGQLGDFAGRGLKPKPEDNQILDRLASGTIDMPLWGVSLDRGIADSYGARFLFELTGPFPAVPAWSHSGIKPEERELITGGRYKVAKVEDRNGTTHALLVWISGLGTPTGPGGPVNLLEE